MSIFKTKEAQRQPDGPRDDEEAAKRGDCSDRAPHLRTDADGNTDNVRPRHELAKADNVGKFPVVDPAALLDGDAACPDDAAASAATAEGDRKKRGEQSGEGNGGLQLLPLRELSHLR